MSAVRREIPVDPTILEETREGEECDSFHSSPEAMLEEFERQLEEEEIPYHDFNEFMHRSQ